MAEYLAPGVYVEDTSFRPKSIAGVGTSTAAFVGMTSRGPLISTSNPPPMLTSFADFEQIYGGFEEFVIDGKYQTNYVAHAAEAFFNNGGGRLYVARVLDSSSVVATSKLNGTTYWTARTKGGSQFARSNSNFQVTVQVIEQTLSVAKARSLAKQAPYTLVRWTPPADPAPAPGGAAPAVAAPPAPVYRYIKDETDTQGAEPGGSVKTATLPSDGASVGVITLNVIVSSPSGHTIDYVSLGLNTNHPRFAETILGATPTRKSDIFNNPVVLSLSDADLCKSLVTDLLSDKNVSPPQGQVAGQMVFELTGGSDGKNAPNPQAYTDALTVLAGLEDISIIAAPGAISQGSDSYAIAINNALIAAAETRRAYRIAVLDAPNADMINDVIAHKGNLDSSRAALYYPWVVGPNPLFGDDPKSEEEIVLPPAGFVCGVYARTDVNRGVWKPPANEVVLGANRFSRIVHFGEQQLLNPMGVNCLRSMPNRGHRVWGARTTSSDPEWMYVNVRRYFLYLETSLDRGTQWAVFEPNGEKLWFNMRETVSDFLYNEWVNGALLGANPKEAFFVRCDRSTMTQNDIDNGRLVCLIGVAAIKPAEFVVFRIGQKLTSSNG